MKRNHDMKEARNVLKRQQEGHTVSPLLGFCWLLWWQRVYGISSAIAGQ